MESDDEELKIQLSETRFLEVTKFRGKILVSIREFYEDAQGVLRHSKKGISLSVDQWATLVENAETINEMILNS